MIFIDSYANSRRIWISLNEGKSYSLVTVPFSIEKIEFHPSISEWLLGYDKIMKEVRFLMSYYQIGGVLNLNCSK